MSVEAAPAPESSPQALCHFVAAERDPDAGIAAFDALLTPRPAKREIVVVAPPEAHTPQPAAGLARLWLEWCCARLAVLVLEPSPEALAGSVLWCRPTALLSTSAQERALAAMVWERSRGRERRAAALLDRLRVLLVAEEGATDPSAGPPVAPWELWEVKRRLVSERAFEPHGRP